MRHDMTTYFDAVIGVGSRPLYNGTPEEVLAWLEDRQQFHDQVRVFVGNGMKFVTVDEYLRQFS